MIENIVTSVKILSKSEGQAPKINEGISGAKERRPENKKEIDKSTCMFRLISLFLNKTFKCSCSEMVKSLEYIRSSNSTGIRLSFE